MAQIFPRFPIDPVTGNILTVAAVDAVPPYSYQNGLKFDSTGAVVVAG